jgi:hypothetical protein
MAAVCHWGDESGKPLYTITFGHVSTCIYMSYRPNDHSFPNSRGSSTCPWYTVGGKMSDKNLEQWINIRFCVTVGKSARETLSLSIMAYDEYTVKKSSGFEWHRQFKEEQEGILEKDENDDLLADSHNILNR